MFDCHTVIVSCVASFVVIRLIGFLVCLAGGLWVASLTACVCLSCLLVWLLTDWLPDFIGCLLRVLKVCCEFVAVCMFSFIVDLWVHVCCLYFCWVLLCCYVC